MLSLVLVVADLLYLLRTGYKLPKASQALTMCVTVASTPPSGLLLARAFLVVRRWESILHSVVALHIVDRTSSLLNKVDQEDLSQEWFRAVQAFGTLTGQATFKDQNQDWSKAVLVLGSLMSYEDLIQAQVQGSLKNQPECGEVALEDPTQSIGLRLSHSQLLYFLSSTPLRSVIA
jgi:hypothetical protein